MNHTRPLPMNDYRIFVGAFPEGDLADRIQALRLRHDARTARITAPHVTLAGTYWRSGPPTPKNEAAVIEQLRSIESRLRLFELRIAGMESFRRRICWLFAAHCCK
jgi:2'-5' RNA ligase